MILDDPDLARVFIARHAMSWADLAVDQARPVYGDYKLDFPVNASSALLTIGRFGPVTQAEIAHHVGFSHQSVAQQLRALTRLGLIERRPDPNDARAYRLMLSRRGRAQYRRLETFCEDASAVFEELFEEAGCDLAAALAKTKRALENRPLKDRFDMRRDGAASSGNVAGRYGENELCDQVE